MRAGLRGREAAAHAGVAGMRCYARWFSSRERRRGGRAAVIRAGRRRPRQDPCRVARLHWEALGAWRGAPAGGGGGGGIGRGGGREGGGIGQGGGGCVLADFF